MISGFTLPQCFFAPKSFGPIVADMLSETDYLVWIGPFTDYSSALYAEQQAKKMGYLEAQNTSFEDNSPAPNMQVAIEPKSTNENAIADNPRNTPIPNQGNPIVFTPPVTVTQSPVVRAETGQTTPTEKPTEKPAFAIAPSFEGKFATEFSEDFKKPKPTQCLLLLGINQI